jgi:hypothetical protein
MISEDQVLVQIQDEPSVLHAVTLVHPTTGDEKLITAWSRSDSFADVHFAVSRKRAELGLKGYEIFEAPRVDGDFSALLERMGAGAMLIQLRSELANRIDFYHPDRRSTILDVISELGHLTSHADAIDHGYEEERSGLWEELNGAIAG